MAGNRFVYDGLDQLKADLRRLPAALAAEAADIVSEAAESAKAQIVYPARSGRLGQDVRVEAVASGPYGAGARVINPSKLAHIFENGTQARHTALGANRGSMPPGHVFVPAVMRARRQMYERLKSLLTQHGLVVTGDAR